MRIIRGRAIIIEVKIEANRSHKWKTISTTTGGNHQIKLVRQTLIMAK